MVRCTRSLAHGCLFVAVGAGNAWAQGIYTCVDAKGRRLTSDRPILECLDRPQQELTSSGAVRRVVPPSMTAEERAAAEQKARMAAEERKRADEEKRRARALVTRYPNAEAHDKERAAALRLVDEVIATGHKRSTELEDQRRKLATEAEFYRSDPAKMPPKLKKQLEENQQQVAAQQRFLADQQEEKKRINMRFDEELAQLKKLWAQQSAAAAKSP